MANIHLALKSRHDEELDWAVFAKHVEPAMRVVDDKTAEEFGAWLQSLWEGKGLCALLRRQAQRGPRQPNQSAQPSHQLVNRPRQPSLQSQLSDQTTERPMTAPMDTDVDGGNILRGEAVASNDMRSPNQGRYHIIHRKMGIYCRNIKGDNKT